MRVVAIILIVIGFAGFLSPLAIGYAGGVGPDVELPNSEITSVARSDDGDIFVAGMFFARVQKYSGTGAYLTGWDVDARGGFFCILIAGDEVLVPAGRTNEIEIFDLKGAKLGSRAPAADAASSLDCGSGAQSLSYREGWGGIEVDMPEGGGQRTVILPRQWWHYAAISPFMSWFMGMMGFFLHPGWRRSIVRAMSRAKP